MKILIIAAHPDDEVLGCGGTIARSVKEGHEVYIAILGEGITSRFGQRRLASKKSIKSLHRQSEKVAQLLGAKDLFMSSLPDNRFDSVPLLEVVKIIEGLVEKVQPESVYTQHGGDLNIDHQVTYRATLTATRPMAGQVVKSLFSYSVASSSEWAFQRFSPEFRPSHFVDIAATLELKVQAMELYEGEARPFPHPRSPEALRAAARHLGSIVGVAAAEAFDPVRIIR